MFLLGACGLDAVEGEKGEILKILYVYIEIYYAYLSFSLSAEVYA
jgi:hypothetical protein